MTWAQETGNKELQVKNWHLKKNAWKKNRKQKRSRKRLASWENDSGPKKESKELQLKNWHLKKMIGAKKSEAKRSTKKSDTLNK